MDNKYNFLVSAFIALFMYILIILLFILYMQKPKINKYESVSKDTVLELELIIDKKISKENSKSKSKPIKIKTKKIVKKSTSISANKKTNLKSLFANVSTKAIVIKNKNVSNIKNNNINSRFKSKYNKQKKNDNLKKSKLVDIKNQKKSKKIKLVNNKGKFNIYYSQISNIILTRWYQYPIYKQNNYMLVSEITIDDKGKFSYHIISYSGNIIVDKAVKEFLQNETSKVYPIAPDGMKKVIKINFKPEIE